MQTHSRFITTADFTIIQAKNVVTEDLRLHSEESPPNVSLYFNLRGNPGLPDGRRQSARLGSQGIWFSPESGLDFQLTTGLEYEVFEVNISLPHFQELAERYPELFGRYFVPILRFEPFEMHSMTITYEMNSVMAEVFRSREHGSAQGMFIETKILELLDLQLLQIVSNSRNIEREVRLRPSDRERMEHARSILQSRMKTPPRLGQLAREVGTNEFKLKRDFKAMFGSTVFDSLLDLRMRHATMLLVETDYTMERIAEDVGYSSAAHFCHAFKRKYGHTPAHVRKSRPRRWSPPGSLPP